MSTVLLSYHAQLSHPTIAISCFVKPQIQTIVISCFNTDPSARFTLKGGHPVCFGSGGGEEGEEEEEEREEEDDEEEEEEIDEIYLKAVL